MTVFGHAARVIAPIGAALALSLPVAASAGQEAAVPTPQATPDTPPSPDGFTLPSTWPTPRAKRTPRPTPTFTRLPAPAPSPARTPSPSSRVIVEPTPRPSFTRVPAPSVQRQPGATVMPGVAPRPVVMTPSASVPAPVPTVSPSAIATAMPGAAPVAQDTPPAEVTPLPAGSASPVEVRPADAVETPEPSETPAAADTGRGIAPGAIAAAVIVLLLAGLLGLGWWRRRRRARAEPQGAAIAAPVPAPAPPPPPSPPPPPPPAAPAVRVTQGDRAELAIELTPRRAGTNLTSAAVDYRVTLRNIGAADARDVRFGLYMLSASAQQASDLQTLFQAPVDTPALAPFTLEAGRDIELTGMALLPRENINVMTIDERPWFVPVLAMKVEYGWRGDAGADGVATAAHMIGIERGEGAKMTPFRLDAGPQMHTDVAARRVA